MKRLLIIGAGGQGRVVCDAAFRTHRYHRIAFLDDRYGSLDAPFPNTPLLGTVADAPRFAKGSEFIVAVGDNETRSRITKKLTDAGLRLATLVHPKAVIGRDVSIGEGSVIMAGAVVQTGTRIGKGCIINTLCAVDHGCLVGDFCHVSVGARLCGAVTIGEGCFVCSGATVINNVTVCGGTTLGAGSVTIGDITEPGTYVGVPVRRIR